MFTFKMHFVEPGGMQCCTIFQGQFISTAIAFFEQEYPSCLLLFVTTTLDRPY